MAKPNYSFEKRQRELAKKRKKEDKKAARASGGGADDALNPNEAAMALPPVVEIDLPADDEPQSPAPPAQP